MFFCVWQQLLWTKVHPLIFSARTCSQRADRNWKRFGCQPTPIVSSKLSMYCDTDSRDNFLLQFLGASCFGLFASDEWSGRKWNFRIFKKIMFLKQFLMNVTFGDIKETNDNNALATIPSHEWSSHVPLIVSHVTDITVVILCRARAHNHLKTDCFDINYLFRCRHSFCYSWVEN